MIEATNAYQLSPVVAAIVGFAVAVAGVVFIVTSRYLTPGLNRLYASLPGRFQYPRWFVPLFGTVLVVFGLVVAAISLAFGVHS